MTSGASGPARRRVLVVEDNYFIADDIVRALQKLGAEIVGPVPTREKALTLVASGENIHAAVLDLNLQGETVFPVADALIARGVPFVFATGYDRSALPPEFEDVPRWEKPFEAHDLAKALSGLLREC